MIWRRLLALLRIRGKRAQWSASPASRTTPLGILRYTDGRGLITAHDLERARRRDYAVKPRYRKGH